MLRIQNALNSDSEGHFKEVVIADLTQHLAEVKDQLNKGVTPNEYQQYTAFSQALQASIEMVEILWKKQHAS